MRSRIVAAAIPCAVFAAAGMAQVYQAVKPQYYSYEKNPVPTPGGWVHDDRFTSMIRVRLSETSTPLSAATETADEIQSRIVGGTLLPDRVAITLQNFGGKGTGSPLAHSFANNGFAFLRTADKLGDLATGLPGPLPEEDYWRHFQPWMKTAVGDRQSDGTWTGGDAPKWMSDYCKALKAQLTSRGLGHVVPARFHMETETTLAGEGFGPNPLYVMVGCEQHIYWSTRPVPGFNGQTMADLWSSAKAEYGWGGPSLTVEQALQEPLGASHPFNRPYFLWWLGVCGRAREAAMEIACYDVIALEWPAPNTPKTSNYDHVRMDMAVDTFAWRKTQIEGTSNAASRPLTKVYRRGAYDRNPFGAFPVVVGASSVPNKPPLMWLMGGDTTNPATFSAPEMYYKTTYVPSSVPERWSHTNNEGNNQSVLQSRWYEPPVNGVPVKETWPQASERYFRHLLDSLTNTTGESHLTVVPWIHIPGQVAFDHEVDAMGNPVDVNGARLPQFTCPEPPEPCVPPPWNPVIKTESIVQTRRTLALLRSKDIREAIMFGNKPVSGAGSATQWNEFKRADAQVYTPAYVKYYVTRGFDIAQPGQLSEGHPGPLMTTLRTTTTPREVLIQSVMTDEFGSMDVTEMTVFFTNIKPLVLGDTGKLILECAVTPNSLAQTGSFPGGEAAWREAIVGRVEFWNYVENKWRELPTLSDEGTVGEYGFYVPDSSTRREFDVILPDTLCDYVDPATCEGSLLVRLTHIAPKLEDGFTSSYDLVQFYHIDDFTVIGGGTPIELGAGVLGGADFNQDGQNTAQDAVGFMAAWSEGSPAGDFNADEEVDVNDLNQFMDALVGE